MTFGLTFETKAYTAWWGARAIYTTSRQIDIVYNRKSAFGDDEEQLQELYHWLDHTGLKLLQGILLKESVSRDSDTTVVVEHGEFYLIASPQSSYGYLYMGAIKKTPEFKPEFHIHNWIRYQKDMKHFVKDSKVRNGYIEKKTEMSA